MTLNYDKQYRAIDSFRLEAVDGRNDNGVRFEWDEETLVTIDSQPWQDAFGTDKFHKAEYVVTRPAEQPYVIDGEQYTFTKPRTDLKEAQWRLDNLPWTLEHPPEKRVVDVDEARGFWRGPYYDEDRDEQRVELYIPTTDDEALEYAAEHEGVSVGFTHDLTAVDEYDGEIGGEVNIDNVDALQTNIYYDHVATTKNPRLPDSGLTAGDSLDVDDSKRREVADSDCGGLSMTVDNYYSNVRHDPSPHYDPHAEVEVEPQVSDGTEITVSEAKASKPYYVCAHLRGDSYLYHSPSLSGSIGEVGPFDGNEVIDDLTLSLEDPLAEQSEVFVTLHYAEADGEKGMHILGERDFVKDSATVLLDESIDGARTTSTKRNDGDAPSGIYVDDGIWYAIGPDEHDDGDQPKYPLTSCSGEDSIEAAWNLRAHGNYTIDQSTLESRIRRAAESMSCDLDIDTETDSLTMDDLDIDDLTVDTIAEQNDDVAEIVEKKDELKTQVDELEEQKEAVKSELDSVKEELDSYKEQERREKIDTLTDLTDHWEEDDLEDVDLETLDDRIELARELTGDSGPTTPQTDNGDGDGGGDGGSSLGKSVDLSHTA